MVSPYRATGRAQGPNGERGFGGPTPAWRASGGFEYVPEPPPAAHPHEDSAGPRALQAFGLSRREARMYLALALGGPGIACRATEASGLQRATAYRVLSRLVARGLVSEHRAWPRQYTAMPLRTLVERNVAFLRDEIDLRRWLVSAFPGVPERPGPWEPRGESLPRGALTGGPAAAPSLPLLVRLGSASDPGILGEIQNARRTVDAVIRPRDIGAGLRSKVAGVLLRASMRGVVVRIVLDYLTADRRLATTLRRAQRGPNLEIRHYTPVGGHFYVLDGRTAARFPLVRALPADSMPGVLSKDPAFVENQAARFEAVWEDAIPRAGPRDHFDARGTETVPPVVAPGQSPPTGAASLRAKPLAVPFVRAARR